MFFRFLNFHLFAHILLTRSYSIRLQLFEKNTNFVIIQLIFHHIHTFKDSKKSCKLPHYHMERLPV